MQIFGLKNCDTCRKALKTLTEHGYAAELIDIRERPLSAAQLGQFHDTFGDALLNTRSTTWRGLSEAQRSRSPLDLLTDHPALMKRPVIVDGAAPTLGWDAKTQAMWLAEQM